MIWFICVYFSGRLHVMLQRSRRETETPESGSIGSFGREEIRLHRSEMRFRDNFEAEFRAAHLKNPRKRHLFVHDPEMPLLGLFQRRFRGPRAQTEAAGSRQKAQVSHVRLHGLGHEEVEESLGTNPRNRRE